MRAALFSNGIWASSELKFDSASIKYFPIKRNYAIISPRILFIAQIYFCFASFDERSRISPFSDETGLDCL